MSPPRRTSSPSVVKLALVLTSLLTAVIVTAGGCTTGTGDTAAPSDAGAGQSPAAGAAVSTNATVVRLVDGDTIVVSLGGRDESTRLIGIDTPETKKPGTPVECFGKEASAHLAELLPVDSAVRLERDVEERDRYDRLLAYVWRADGLFVNLAMARDGFAAQLTVPPNVAHADEFGAAAREAREAGRGLWGRCDGPHTTTPE